MVDDFFELGCAQDAFGHLCAADLGRTLCIATNMRQAASQEELWRNIGKIHGFQITPWEVARHGWRKSCTVRLRPPRGCDLCGRPEVPSYAFPLESGARACRGCAKRRALLLDKESGPGAASNLNRLPSREEEEELEPPHQEQHQGRTQEEGEMKQHDEADGELICLASFFTEAGLLDEAESLLRKVLARAELEREEKTAGDMISQSAEAPLVVPAGKGATGPSLPAEEAAVVGNDVVLVEACFGLANVFAAKAASLIFTNRDKALVCQEGMAFADQAMRATQHQKAGAISCGEKDLRVAECQALRALFARHVACATEAVGPRQHAEQAKRAALQNAEAEVWRAISIFRRESAKVDEALALITLAQIREKLEEAQQTTTLTPPARPPAMAGDIVGSPPSGGAPSGVAVGSGAHQAPGASALETLLRALALVGQYCGEHSWARARALRSFSNHFWNLSRQRPAPAGSSSPHSVTDLLEASLWYGVSEASVLVVLGGAEPGPALGVHPLLKNSLLDSSILLRELGRNEEAYHLEEVANARVADDQVAHYADRGPWHRLGRWLANQASEAIETWAAGFRGGASSANSCSKNSARLAQLLDKLARESGCPADLRR